MTAPLLEVAGLSRDFDLSRPILACRLRGEGRRVVRAVQDVSFTLARGETFALVGESGCGKSTVARLVVGLHAPSAGTVRYDGATLDARARARLRGRMTMIFQDPYASLDPRWRVADIVAEPLRALRLAGGAEAAARARALLTQVGLVPADALRFPHAFSGGQRQRISIARALAAEPSLIVCDEPTSALDVSVQAQILNLMRDLQAARGLSYLFISHNLAVVRHMADGLGVMYLGRLVETGSAATIFRTPRHPYTRMLLASVPDLARRRPPAPPAGELPSPIAPPPGCAFHPRCPLANARCRTERPGETLRDGVRIACHAVEEGRELVESLPTQEPTGNASLMMPGDTGDRTGNISR